MAAEAEKRGELNSLPACPFQRCDHLSAAHNPLRVGMIRIGRSKCKQHLQQVLSNEHANHHLARLAP